MKTSMKDRERISRSVAKVLDYGNNEFEVGRRYGVAHRVTSVIDDNINNDNNNNADGVWSSSTLNEIEEKNNHPMAFISMTIAVGAIVQSSVLSWCGDITTYILLCEMIGIVGNYKNNVIQREEGLKTVAPPLTAQPNPCEGIWLFSEV